MHIVNLDKYEFILLDIDGVILDQCFDNIFWSKLVPREVAIKCGISLDKAKIKVQEMGEELSGTLPWYEISYWEEFFGIDLIACARRNSSLINFLPNAEFALKKISKLKAEVIYLTNCDARLLQVKSESVPFLKYCSSFQSSTDLRLVKEDDSYWPLIYKKFKINPSKSIFLDDNKKIINTAKSSGLSAAYHVLEPTSDGSVIYRRDNVNSLCRLSDLLKTNS